MEDIVIGEQIMIFYNHVHESPLLQVPLEGRTSCYKVDATCPVSGCTEEHQREHVLPLLSGLSYWSGHLMP